MLRGNRARLEVNLYDVPWQVTYFHEIYIHSVIISEDSDLNSFTNLLDHAYLPRYIIGSCSLNYREMFGYIGIFLALGLYETRLLELIIKSSTVYRTREKLSIMINLQKRREERSQDGG